VEFKERYGPIYTLFLGSYLIVFFWKWKAYYLLRILRIVGRVEFFATSKSIFWRSKFGMTLYIWIALVNKNMHSWWPDTKISTLPRKLELLFCNTEEKFLPKGKFWLGPPKEFLVENDTWMWRNKGILSNNSRWKVLEGHGRIFSMAENFFTSIQAITINFLCDFFHRRNFVWQFLFSIFSSDVQNSNKTKKFRPHFINHSQRLRHMC
jgi:hypothetical protein